MTYVKQIGQRLDALTSAQQGLARFILDRSDEVAFMTARQLADAVGQSDAAVVRFARAVGYEGYADMRRALREGMLERAGASGMREQNAVPDSESELKKQIFEIDAGLIASTGELNEDGTGARIVDRLIAARRVWITGHGTTYPLAAYLAMHLNQVLGKVATFNVELGDLSDRFRDIGPGDLFIGIGYARYLPYTVEILDVARRLGAEVVAITDRHSSPLARLADDSLFVARGSSTFAWWSQAGTLALADWLTALVMIRDADNVNRRLRQADELWKRLGHWKSAGNNQDDPTLEQRLSAGLAGNTPTPDRT